MGVDFEKKHIMKLWKPTPHSRQRSIKELVEVMDKFA
jgi:hypothetical protein